MKQLMLYCMINFLLLVGTNALYGQVPQVVKVNFLNNGTDTYLCLDDESSLAWGDASEDEVLIYRLEAGENGYLEIMVDNIGNADFTISLVEDGGSQIFEMAFDNGTLITSVSSLSVNPSDFLRIQRCTNRIDYYLNTQLLGSVNITNSLPLFARLNVTSADPDANGNMPFVWMKFPWVNNSDCPEPPNRKDYVELREKLDAAYTTLRNGKLRFTYIEDYATVAGTNAVVSYQIYNDFFQALTTSGMSGSLLNAYGVNWHELLVDSLALHSFYILEVKGINKNETYYLRFKME